MSQAVEELAAKKQEAKKAKKQAELDAIRTWSAGEAACRRKREEFATREARRKDIEAKKNADPPPSWMP